MAEMALLASARDVAFALFSHPEHAAAIQNQHPAKSNGRRAAKAAADTTNHADAHGEHFIKTLWNPDFHVLNLPREELSRRAERL